MAYTCELDKLNLIGTDRGQYDAFLGIDKLFDPEKYVDTDIQLSKYDNETRVKTYINSNVTPELYHVYNYNYNNKRTSFLGLYRKFSEADVHELMEYTEGKRKNESEIDMNTLFASFYGNSLLSIIYNDLPTMQLIADKLERTEFLREKAFNYMSD